MNSRVPWRAFWFLLAVFVVFSFVGYYTGKSNPEMAMRAIRKLMERIGPLSSSSFHNFIRIFTNNSMVALMMLLSGLFFGLGPWFIMAFNGLVVGLVVFAVHEKAGLSIEHILLGLLPHGVVEIPAIAIAGVAGIAWYKEITEGEGTAGKRFIRGAVKGIKLYFLSVALLFVAAFIEAYITPRVAGF